MINSGNRLHGIDALRAFAMLSGVVLHSTLAYRVATVPLLPHDPQFQHWSFDFIFFLVHSFRMPLFFMIAGFFCRMVYFKSGEKKFLKQRMKRIGIPFIIGVLIIAPLTLLPKYLYWYTTNDGLTLQQAFAKTIQKIIRFNEIEHIWFLRNLIIFYLLVFLVQRLKKVPFAGHRFSYLATIWKNARLNLLWLILLTIPVWVLLITMPGWYVTTDTYMIPRGLSILLYYAYFFALGWLLHLRSDIFNLFTKRYLILLAGAAITTMFVWYAKQNLEFPKTSFKIILFVKFITALQMMLLVSAISGLFLKLLNTENATSRYLSDASYWVYLVHLAVIMLLQWQLINSPIPGIFRFPVVLGVTSLFAFVTYHYFVRYTVVGDILHGPRMKKTPGKPALEKA